MHIHDTHDGDKSAPQETMYDIQERRQRLLYDACHKYEHIVNQSTRARYEMYYDDQMDYIYCLVSKASCTSWKRTLMMLSGQLTNFKRPEQLSVGLVHNFASSDRYVPRLETLPEELRSSRFINYFTFMFVREPLERLVSGYRDKLLVDPAYHVDIDIVRRYRPHEYNPSVKRYNVTFAEFVRYVLDQRAAGRVLDRHWIPQYELCRVCLYRYDFIGHQETLHRDAEYVVSKLKSRIRDPKHRRRVASITFPADSGHQVKSIDYLQQMFSSVPAAHVRALYQLYAVDYALFGFEHPNVTGFT